MGVGVGFDPELDAVDPPLHPLSAATKIARAHAIVILAVFEQKITRIPVLSIAFSSGSKRSMDLNSIVLQIVAGVPAMSHACLPRYFCFHPSFG